MDFYLQYDYPSFVFIFVICLIIQIYSKNVPLNINTIRSIFFKHHNHIFCKATRYFSSWYITLRKTQDIVYIKFIHGIIFSSLNLNSYHINHGTSQLKEIILQCCKFLPKFQQPLWLARYYSACSKMAKHISGERIQIVWSSSFSHIQPLMIVSEIQFIRFIYTRIFTSVVYSSSVKMIVTLSDIYLKLIPSSFWNNSHIWYSTFRRCFQALHYLQCIYFKLTSSCPYNINNSTPPWLNTRP